MKLFFEAAHTVNHGTWADDIFISQRIRHSISLHVEPTLTIKALKAKLKTHHWIPKKKLLLVHSEHLKPLNRNTSTVSDCLLKDKDKLFICMGGSYPLKVRNGNNFDILINNCFETVRDVKDKIFQKTGCLPEDQLLRYKIRDLDDDGASLVSLGIVYRENDVLVVHMTRKKMPEQSLSFPSAKFLSHMQDLTCKENTQMNIFVEHRCGVHPNCVRLQVNPADTIKTLKTKSFIKNCLKYLKIPALACGPNLLENGSFTLAQYGIKKHDVIQMFDNVSFGILVSWASLKYRINESPRGLEIEVVCFDKVKDLKQKIKNKTNIPPEKQHLMLGGMPMDHDERCLMDYGIFKPIINNVVVMLRLKESHSLSDLDNA